MGEVANTIFGVADAIKPGGLIDVGKEVLGRSGKFPDLRELVEKGSLEASDVANFLRSVQIQSGLEARALKKAIRGKREVESVYLGEDEKNYKVALSRREKHKSEAKYALTVLNAVRMPGPVFVSDYDKKQAAEIVLGQMDPDNSWRYSEEIRELVNPHSRSSPLRTTVRPLTKAVCDAMRV